MHLPHHHNSLPRFGDYHPSLGWVDLLIYAGGSTASVFGTLVVAANGFNYTGAAGLVAAFTGVAGVLVGGWINHEKNAIDKFKAETAAKAQSNADEIAEIKKQADRIAKESHAKILAVQAATDRQDRENREKIAALQAQNAGQAQELARLRSGQHDLRDQMQTQAAVAAIVAATGSNDPDRPQRVIVENDPQHPVPTQPQLQPPGVQP